MSIYAKLAKVQQGLKVPKDLYNDFGKYKYRSVESILEELKPLLEENNLVILFDDELIKEGERYYIKATVTLIDLDEKGTPINGQIQTTAYAREEESKRGMDGSQITGASSSYARKYALNGMFAIDDTKDSDTTNKGNKNSKAGDKISDAQLELIVKLAKGKNFANRMGPYIKEKYNKNNSRELNKTEASEIIKVLNEMKVDDKKEG